LFVCLFVCLFAIKPKAQMNFVFTIALDQALCFQKIFLVATSKHNCAAFPCKSCAMHTQQKFGQKSFNQNIISAFMYSPIATSLPMPLPAPVMREIFSCKRNFGAGTAAGVEVSGIDLANTWVWLKIPAPRNALAVKMRDELQESVGPTSLRNAVRIMLVGWGEQSSRKN
jgi:hypothetical protein